MDRWSIAALALLVACAGEARTEPQRPNAVEPVDEPAPAALAAEPAEEPTVAAPEAPDFDAPMPDELCPEQVSVLVAHADQALPPRLEHAVALRSEDRRRLRIAIADRPIERDDAGRFVAPGEGGARFEMDARRSRRGPLDPRVLGPPDAPRGGLTHVRVVTPTARLTFGHRNIGRVELTEIADDHVCGRIELDDGFTRVRGAFLAPFVSELPP